MSIPAPETSVLQLQYIQNPPICQDLKRCGLCGLSKRLSEFNRCSKAKDGLQAYCRDCMRDIQEDWYTENRDQAFKKNIARRVNHRRNHPDRYFAQRILSRAIVSGRLIPQPCRWLGCGSTENIEGHHCSYERPYEIVWLCRDHHRAADACKGKIGFDLQIDVIPAPRRRLRPVAKRERISL